MAITQITSPSALPLSTSDYEAQNNLLAAALAYEAFPFDGGVVLKGAMFVIQGSVFICDADTTISGTTSNYVTLTVSGTSATASYAEDLDDVSWSSVYNGYYDTSSNLVVFNELRAFLQGVISTAHFFTSKIVSQVANQMLLTTSDVTFDGLTVDSLVSVDASISNLIANSVDLSDLATTPYWRKILDTSNFSSPGTVPTGLAYDSSTGNLISCDSLTDLIYIHDGVSSSILSSFSSPGVLVAGLTIDSSTGNLISCDSGTDTISVHSGISSTVSSSFSAPSTNISGLAYDSSTGNLISCDRDSELIYVHDGISSTILYSFSAPGGDPRGITFDPNTLSLISSSNDTTIVYIHDRITEDVLETIEVSSVNFGLTFDSDEQDLIRCNTSDDIIEILNPGRILII